MHAEEVCDTQKSRAGPGNQACFQRKTGPAVEEMRQPFFAAHTTTESKSRDSGLLGFSPSWRPISEIAGVDMMDADLATQQ